MQLILDRHTHTEEYTQGHLWLRRDWPWKPDRFLAHTLERPWADNEPGHSCIPEGDYVVEPWTRPNGDNVFIVSGGSVCKLPDELSENKTRCLILFHSANFPRQIQGCIAPGRRAAAGTVENSRLAMQDIRGELGSYFSHAPAIGMTIRSWTDSWLPQKTDH